MAGIQPLHKDFVNILTRLETFQKFPHSFINKEVLARAGFFFAPNFSIGEFDLCVCFSCGVKLFKWEPYDDPWEEHMKFIKVKANCDHMNEYYQKKPDPQKFIAPQASNLRSSAPAKELHENQVPTHHQRNTHQWSQNPPMAPGQWFSPSDRTRMGYNPASISKSSKPDYNLEGSPMSQEKINQNSCVYVKSPAPQPPDKFNAHPIRSELHTNDQAQYNPSISGQRFFNSTPFMSNPPNPNYLTQNEYPSPLQPLPKIVPSNQTNQYPASQVEPETYNPVPPNMGIYTQRPTLYDKPKTQPQVFAPQQNFRPQYYTHQHTPFPYTQMPGEQFIEQNRTQFAPQQNNFPPSFQKQT